MQTVCILFVMRFVHDTVSLEAPYGSSIAIMSRSGSRCWVTNVITETDRRLPIEPDKLMLDITGHSKPLTLLEFHVTKQGEYKHIL